MEFMMYKGMEGPHDFRVKVITNDPTKPEAELVVLSNWGNWLTREAVRTSLSYKHHIHVYLILPQIP